MLLSFKTSPPVNVRLLVKLLLKSTGPLHKVTSLGTNELTLTVSENIKVNISEVRLRSNLSSTGAVLSAVTPPSITPNALSIGISSIPFPV